MQRICFFGKFIFTICHIKIILDIKLLQRKSTVKWKTYLPSFCFIIFSVALAISVEIHLLTVYIKINYISDTQQSKVQVKVFQVVFNRNEKIWKFKHYLWQRILNLKMDIPGINKTVIESPETKANLTCV